MLESRTGRTAQTGKAPWHSRRRHRTVAVTIEIRLLGAVEVHDEAGAPVAVTGVAPRAVLAMLALRLGSVVRVDEIVDGLWAVELPGDPAAALQVTVSRLRRALGAERAAVARRGGGYALELPAEAVDVARAEDALRDGRAALDRGAHAEAAQRLCDGLREWRGQPLSEFVDLPFATPAISRLHSLRLALLEARNAALLATGDVDAIVAETEEAIEGDPWREELVGQLMTALYQSNRQVEALAAYARLSSALRRDFGISPSPALQQLHEQILQHDPALARPGAAAARLDEPVRSLPQWFRLTLDAEAESDGHLRCRLLLALGEAQHHAGEPGWRETLLAAADLALELDDHRALARAALGGALGWTLDPGEPDERRIALIDRALAAGDDLDPGARARLVAARGAEVAFTAPLAERLAASDEAMRLARKAGEPATLLTVLTHRFNTVWAPETLADRRRTVREAAALAADTNQPVAAALAAGWQMATAVEDGDALEADRHLTRFSELASALDVPVLRWGAVLHRSWRCVLDGDLAEAERLCHEARAVGQRGSRPEAEVVAITQLAGIRWAEGRLGEELASIDALTAALPHFTALRAWLAVALHGAGDRAAAQAMLDESWGGRHRVDLPRNQLYLAALVLWAELAEASDHRAAASALTAALQPHRDQFAFTGSAVYGPAAHALARLALVTGDVDQARRHLDRAADLAARMPSPFFAARVAATAAGGPPVSR